MRVSKHKKSEICRDITSLLSDIMTQFRNHTPFVFLSTLLLLLTGFTLFNSFTGDGNEHRNKTENKRGNHKTVNIFLCGDVMTGRGVDQILEHPSDPALYEPYMKSAAGYVKLAEEENGNIRKPVTDSYIWGDSLEVFRELNPDIKIINLETAVTVSEDHWKGKGINYRMNPANTGVLTSAGIDYASLANNHILDWGYSGLSETVSTLDNAGIRHSGAGENIRSASEPAVIRLENNRIIILSIGSADSGIPLKWKADTNKPGVNLMSEFSREQVREIKKQLDSIRKPGDLVVVSIHWGGNWGYQIPKEHRKFAHELIDTAGVDLIHGHSSHHPKGIEIYKGKPVIYGAGDFINDYEGISGYEKFRGDLTLMYFVTIDTSNNNLDKFTIVPMQIKNFRLKRTNQQDTKWLQKTLSREGKKLGNAVRMGKEGFLYLEWN